MLTRKQKWDVAAERYRRIAEAVDDYVATACDQGGERNPQEGLRRVLAAAPDLRHAELEGIIESRLDRLKDIQHEYLKVWALSVVSDAAQDKGGAVC